MMIKWETVFHPASGQRESPFDFIKNLKINEIKTIRRKLETISQLETYEWPKAWIKPVRDFYQLTAGDFRLYLFIDDSKIVVCHACRKVGQKAREEDLLRAKLNQESYLSYKGKSK